MKAAARIGWNLRKMRVAAGIPQDELARLAELDHAYVGYIERGKRNLTVSTLEKIASALEVDISEFFQHLPEGAEEISPLRSGRKKKNI
jgi:transcriptional regulator with XRE-family HTH domain